MRKALIVACCFGAVLMAGCGRNVDVSAVNATLVPGTTSLYRFCDAANLIYFSKVDGDSDVFEFFIPGGCEPSAVSPPPPTPSSAVPGVNGGGR